MSVASIPSPALARRRFAAVLLALAAGMAPAAAAEPPAVEVDLSVLETLDSPSRPLPPLPPRRIPRPAAAARRGGASGAVAVG
ncbi:MAG: hypothetical protein HKM95_00205, partial [Inquilinus sp.]|nr:hypothetical protein [Inquilinus sp.]